MSIFDSLYNAATDISSLDSFLKRNITNIADFCSENVETQKIELDKFEYFVLFKTSVIKDLDYSKSYNRAFVYYLVEYCERFCSTSAIVQLYQIIQDNNLNIGSRLDAAMLYLYNTPSNDVFVERFEEICAKLQIAINEEDDDDKKSIASFLNYYSYVIYNTSQDFAQKLQSKYTIALENKNLPFLKNNLIRESLSLDIQDSGNTYQTIQANIDKILGKKESGDIISYITNDDFLIETSTNYAELLKKVSPKFQAIRDISVKQFNQYENQNDIFYSLGRGVKILNEDAQLYSYINSYGNMHEAKMLSALQYLPLDELYCKNIEIFDWACGQGLASTILFEYINNHKSNLNIRRVVLIEPSEIALKRAALHVRHFDKQCEIKTVLKDIDAVQYADIKSNIDAVKIHLFSNILDVDGFSLEHLVSLVEQTQKGNNYFVCVSPYITDAKTARIDEFVQHFANNYSSFKTYYEVENQKGDWKNNWTRVIRVFKVKL